MQVTISIKVFCPNNFCPKYLHDHNRRFIGEDGGLGGKWQCSRCNKWTERAPTT